MCGGTIGAVEREILKRGLSPRVRGNLQLMQLMRQPPRSIPACAGEPDDTDTRDTPAAVYPRVCGGTRPRALTFWESIGLSPRVRGNLDERYNPPPSMGSIPACAGEPGPAPGVHSTDTVYPRVCGGTENERTSAPYSDGLSPRVRGNRRSMTDAISRIRSIPACAGEPR